MGRNKLKAVFGKRKAVMGLVCDRPRASTDLLRTQEAGELYGVDDQSRQMKRETKREGPWCTE